MRIIPAIDIKNGKCVRLFKGDFEKVTDYGDPVKVAERWIADGADILHIVNLDGSKLPEGGKFSVVKDVISKIIRIKNSELIIQVGGGVRSLKVFRDLIEMGVERIILGSLVFEREAELKKIIDSFGTDNIVLAVDALDGKVLTRGWIKDSGVRVIDAIERFKKLGIDKFLYTDVDRDGTLEGPNIKMQEKLMSEFPDLLIIASGGVSSDEDLKKLDEAGVKEVIVGKALYEGKISYGRYLSR